MNQFAMQMLGISKTAPVLSIEEANGQLTVEKEYLFYGKVKDIDALVAAAHTKRVHEQWLVFETEDKSTKQRIRCIDEETYILTTKRKKEGMVGQFEVECPISSDMFAILRLIGSGGRKCTRLTFPVPDSELVWEIDVYMTTTGAYSPWVKIDLEVKQALQSFPDLPAEFETFISHQPSDYTDEEKAMVANCWDSEWASLEATTPSHEDNSKNQ